jgi:hypothetical protein
MSTDSPLPDFVLSPQSDVTRPRAPRFVLDWGIFCAFSTASENPSRRALLHDISGHGVAFILREPLAQGSTLTVQLPTPQNQAARNLVACVAHCTQVCESAWLVGCSLSEALSETDLAGLRTIDPNDTQALVHAQASGQSSPDPRKTNRGHERRCGPLSGIRASLLPGELGLGKQKPVDLINLSEAGAAVRTEEEYRMGQEVTLMLDAAYLYQPLELPATVCRVNFEGGRYELSLVLRKPLAHAQLVRVTQT